LSLTIGLAGVNVGQPTVIGERNGEDVLSAIAKRPVATGTTLRASELGLAGDAQADLTVHGGGEKAVYAYPSEHLAVWTDELGEELGPAPFGENLSIVGLTEAEAGIGDVWGAGRRHPRVVPAPYAVLRAGVVPGPGRHPVAVQGVGTVGLVPAGTDAR